MLRVSELTHGIFECQLYTLDPSKQIGYCVFRAGFVLIATKAEEIPDDGLNSLPFTPLLRHQLLPITLNGTLTVSAGKQAGIIRC